MRDAVRMLSVPTWMEGVAFTVAQGRSFGMTDAVMRGRSLQKPHHGVRVVGTAGRIDSGLIDACLDLHIVVPTDAVFSHATAARLWGIPLPAWVSTGLHVMVPDAAHLRRPGTFGWTRAGSLTDVRDVHGIRTSSPADTWVQLATMSAARGGFISREWLVAIGDYLISGRRARYGRDAPLATPDELAAALSRHGSGRGAARLSWALSRIRMPVDSPPETFVRLGLVARRLPEPEVQPPIRTLRRLRHPDLGYPDRKVLIEYLGDVHRTDPDTWRRDLIRVQEFQDLGNTVFLAGAADLSPQGLTALAHRVRRALR